MSKYQCTCIFMKLGMCIDIAEIWFGIADGQILSIFDRFISLPQDIGGVLSFHIFIVVFVIICPVFFFVCLFYMAKAGLSVSDW